MAAPVSNSAAAVRGAVGRRLGIVVAGVFAVAVIAVTVAVRLLEPTTASSFLVMVGGGMVGFVAGLVTAVGVHPPRAVGRIRARVAERDRAVDDAYLIEEMRWRWRKAAEGAGIGEFMYTPTGVTVSIPIVLRVQLRPTKRLTIRLRQGQLVRDIVAVQSRLCELMEAKGIRIARLSTDVVTVELW
jgi:hypothetical protein